MTPAESPKGRRVGPYVAVGILALLIPLVVVFATRDTQRSTATDTALGEPAPAITGTDLAGRPYDIDHHRGEWVVVNFFATWCAGCVLEHPELVEFSERHADGGASVVSVAFDDDSVAVAGFFEERGGSWPVLIAGVDGVAINYGVTAVPETYLVSPAGFVVDKLVGPTGVTADALDARIAAFEKAAAEASP
jgi:cytochrome c biogenesis protein CcmG/thiol:disulfide interchange protein DsbE